MWLVQSVLCLWNPEVTFCPFRVGISCCIYVQIEVVRAGADLCVSRRCVYSHFCSLQGSDDASAMGPSELILTRGTLDEEEETESDTDDIDHEGKGMRDLLWSKSGHSSQETPSVFH